MNLLKVFDESFKRAKDLKYEFVYVLVDIHDTIFHATFDKEEKYEYFQYAKEALRLMSNINEPSIKLILWSSSYEENLAKYVKKLQEDGIKVDYVNENPEAENTRIACFDKKPYFNVGIDNAFGFDAEHDWEVLFNHFAKNPIFSKKNS